MKARQEEINEVERLKEENERLQTELQMKFNPANMIGNGQAMHVVFSLISKVAPTTANVLITGESGTGKEVVARAIHVQSERVGGPFEAVNCKALSAGETRRAAEMLGISFRSFRYKLKKFGIE